jgi:hypothetical protein
MSSKKKKLLNEMIEKQLKNVSLSKKFTYKDIMRVIKHIEKSIFGKQCCLWQGFVANTKQNKSPYINFYFREKKLALHRLLYSNFVESLSTNEYIRFTCKNKGKCCTLNHMIKYEKDENINDSDSENDIDNNNDNNICNNNIDVIKNVESNKKSKQLDFTISFD